MNLHDNLGRYGADASTGSRNRLESAEVREALSERVRRGRRRRVVAGGFGAGAGVTLVAVGVWAVAPGLGGSMEVAGPGEPAAAGPYRYVVDDVLDEYTVLDVPLQAPEVFLRGDGAVMCGDEVTLTSGVSIHHEEALGRALFFEAELVTLGDVSPYDPPATPEPINPELPDGPTNSWDPSEPVWDGWAGGVMGRHVSTTLLMDGGNVVGVLEGSSFSHRLEGEVEGTAGSRVPSVGYCDLSNMSWDDLRELERGDAMNTLLVSQFWGDTQTGEDALLATIVVDPHEPANSSTSPRDNHPEWDEPIDDSSPDPVPDGPAELRLPEGDTYQAFVVPGPEMSCAPFADQLAAGQPGLHNIQYEVELPGVAESLTGELWGAETVVTLPTGEDPWYKGLNTWIVAEDVSAGIKDPALGWHEQVLSSGLGAPDPVRGQDCAYVQPIPEISGAVFLVVNGVDTDAVEQLGSEVSWAVSPSETHTWIYLGEAD